MSPSTADNGPLSESNENDESNESNERNEIIALQRENAKLKKINQVLVQRIENGLGNDSSAYSSFESAVILSEKVKERTLQLQQALSHLETLNNDLTTAKREAEYANLTKTKFLAAVSHDLLQPISAARLFTTALQEHRLPAAAARLVQSLNYSMEDVESLVGTLVDISKLDAGVVEPDITSFNASSLLENLANEFFRQAAQAGLRFRFVPCSAVISTDPQLLARILRNLLSNAIRYTNQGSILFGCRRHSEGLLIQVWDTGIGIPQEQLTEIFLEFKRLPSTQNHGAKGLGLGLAIVDKISRILGNQIYVRSKWGKGSVFSILVPYGESPGGRCPAKKEKQVAEKHVEDAPLPALKCPIAGRRILILENDASICEGMETLLTSWGCRVVTAASIHDLDADTLRRQRPDLMIADYHLDNDETGIDAARQLQQWLTLPPPVLMITANRTQELKQQVRQLGYRMLNKPIKPHKLKSMLRHFLGTGTE